MQVELKLINQILENLNNPTAVAGVSRVSSSSSNDGDYGEERTIFTTPMDDIFLSIIYRSDSYGDNTSIYSAQFVKQKEQTVINYESI